MEVLTCDKTNVNNYLGYDSCANVYNCCKDKLFTAPIKICTIGDEEWDGDVRGSKGYFLKRSNSMYIV